ncbi:hypothetical protein [Cellulomonas timonensis]|uniref:hypothetical protein n=1 Tax=Cellulomonas timonensis TaxID=1689271 RepID=UPI0008295788|nr:hypothetical protein [Cellulomonas timonensis]
MPPRAHPPSLPTTRSGPSGRAAARRRVAAATGALALLLLLLVGWPVATRMMFDARAEPGWAVVQGVLGDEVRAVHDSDPEGPTFALDLGAEQAAPGQRVAVRYDPDDMQRVVPAASSVWSVPLLLGAAFAPVLAAVAIGAAARGRRGRG